MGPQVLVGYVFCLLDDNFNVTALADANGAVLERYAYDAYGAPKFFAPDWSAREDSTYANGVLFAGYWRDSKTGLYCVRNRTFHPLYGRWMQRDPLGYADGTSLYEYVGDRVGWAAFAAHGIARGSISANLDQAFIPNICSLRSR